MKAKISYLKDKEGNFISPIVDVNSIYKDGEKFTPDSKPTYSCSQLYSGRLQSGQISLSDVVSNYTFALILSNTTNYSSSWFPNFIPVCFAKDGHNMKLFNMLR